MTPDSETTVANIRSSAHAENIRAFLSNATEEFARKPFKPFPAFTSGHGQTLAGYAWPRRHRLPAQVDEERLFEVAKEARVLAHCGWQAVRTNHPTLVVWQGMRAKKL